MLKHIIVFTKAQFSALIGGMVDYGIMIFVVEVFHIHYTLGIVIGGIVGALINFTLNKQWTFNSEGGVYHNSLFKQLLKFSITVINSIVLKSSGTYFLSTFFSIDYKITRIMVDIVVSTCFNFTLQKEWVFKKAQKDKNISSEQSFQPDPLNAFIRQDKAG